MTFVRRLSPKQEQALLVDYEDDWSINDISVIYKVSVRTVYRVLAKHNAPRRCNPRKKRRSPKPKAIVELKPCGTNAAYARHKRDGEYPCTACLAAHAADVARHKNKKG